MSEIFSPEFFIQNITGAIAIKKQVNYPYFDLTVQKLFRIKTGGQLDFGGSEYEQSSTTPCLPVKRKPEDQYGWWDLHEGYFLIKYNERLNLMKNQGAILQPHNRLLACGCFHPTLMITKIDDLFRILLWVPKIGIKIKENSRISQLIIFEH